MSYTTSCPYGHGYIAADVYSNWTPGVPKCPHCRRLLESASITANQKQEFNHCPNCNSYTVASGTICAHCLAPLTKESFISLRYIQTLISHINDVNMRRWLLTQL